jgi:hypothetical protein
MAPKNTTGPNDYDSVRAVLATIEGQTRQTLELLRTLIGLIVPMVDERDGPPLEDLIATLVAQNRDLLAIARRTLVDVRVIGDRLGASGGQEENGQRAKSDEN